METNLGAELVNVVTLKWGERYGPEYANKLFNQVKEHLNLPFNFICFTDNPTGLNPEIRVFPIPEIDLDDDRIQTGWRKISLFRNDLPLSGNCLFLDLDIVITDNIDCFFHYEPNNIVIIRDWLPLRRQLFPKGPAVGNSSVFRFKANQQGFIFEQFEREKPWALANFSPPQAYLTHCIRPYMKFWPDDWVISFKEHCRPFFPTNYWREGKRPTNAKIVVFHGRPDPDEAAYGFRGKKPHHFVRPTGWVKEIWEKS